MVCRIEAIPMTSRWSYRYATVDKISTDISCRAVPLRQRSFLFVRLCSS